MSDRSLGTKTHKMTEGNPLRTILLFAIPMILSNLFQQFYNVIDTVIVGKRLGTHALAAVGSASSITAVFVQLATGLALGGSIVIAQYFGAGKTEKIWQSMSTSVLFSAGVALVSTIIILAGAEPILKLVNTPKEIVGMGAGYLRLYFLGCIPIFVYNALNGVYVALGDSRTPLRFLIISSVLNVMLDLFFIMLLQWGVGGAALATAISQFAAAALAMKDIPKLLKEFQHEPNAPLFDKTLLFTMLRFALPSALQQSIVSVGSVVVQATINSFGPAVIAGSAAAAKVINLATAIPINYSNAYANYVGQNIGACKEERIGPGLWNSIVSCGGLSLILTAIFEIFPEHIIRLFIEETEADMEQVIAVGTAYIRVVGAFLIIFSTFMLVKATFKGSGDMGWFIMTTLLSFFIRLFLTVGFAHVVGVEIIWWAFCAGWTIALLVSLARYLGGGWRTKRITGPDDV
ncbi:MAG: MATE family efflux transporter [Lachnospiraceae bacterium]|mgnify:FL=1|nr:MATE family efflux transporter [Lachnospiraceae bacterium]MDE7019323.1 MATE family efflux transporter [Lachnospiraceae bacterium]